MEAPEGPIRVLVVDDHPIVRQGVRSLLATYTDIQIVAEAATPAAALAAARQFQPDVVLLDIRLPGMTGIEVTRQLAQCTPTARVIMLTNYEDDDYLIGALQAGAHGYLLKSVSDEMLVWTIRAVYRGQRLISPDLMDRVLDQFAEFRRVQLQRELDLDDEEVRVLRLVAGGASNEAIGRDLNWSQSSVKRKVQHIFYKLGVTTRAQAAAEAVRRGVV
ncbi:MAG TPA: response regulator transcription factor [Chloroflexota bacterium]|nr:response regulator transcription factor [Chloroflexota bacterium]